MLVRPVSDIHNEFSLFNLPETDADSQSVLVLAGDIALADRVESTLSPFLENVSPRFRDVLYIPGNHEYYRSSLTRADQKLKDACSRHSNVHFVQKKSMVIDDVMFIGATLWTDLNNCDPNVLWDVSSRMNDYEVIRTGPNGQPYRRKARPIDMVEINREHRAFLEERLTSPDRSGLKTVVITHHQPLMALNQDHYPSSNLDYAYYNTGLENLVLDHGPDLWISGHTHHFNDTTIGPTRFICNPRGYTRDGNGDEGLGFVRDLLIEL